MTLLCLEVKTRILLLIQDTQESDGLLSLEWYLSSLQQPPLWALSFRPMVVLKSMPSSND
jgi:hypothetical protein